MRSTTLINKIRMPKQSVTYVRLAMTFNRLTFAKKQERINSAWVRKLALNFEKRISKNAELRAKHENDPQKYGQPGLWLLP